MHFNGEKMLAMGALAFSGAAIGGYMGARAGASEGRFDHEREMFPPHRGRGGFPHHGGPERFGRGGFPHHGPRPPHGYGQNPAFGPEYASPMLNRSGAPMFGNSPYALQGGYPPIGSCLNGCQPGVPAIGPGGIPIGTYNGRAAYNDVADYDRNGFVDPRETMITNHRLQNPMSPLAQLFLQDYSQRYAYNPAGG